MLPSRISPHSSEISVRDVCASPFCTLVEFSCREAANQPKVLVVTPISGHFAILLRDLVLDLLPHFRVYVTIGRMSVMFRFPLDVSISSAISRQSGTSFELFTRASRSLEYAKAARAHLQQLPYWRRRESLHRRRWY